MLARRFPRAPGATRRRAHGPTSTTRCPSRGSPAPPHPAGSRSRTPRTRQEPSRAWRLAEIGGMDSWLGRHLKPGHLCVMESLFFPFFHGDLRVGKLDLPRVENPQSFLRADPDVGEFHIAYRD